MMRRAIGSGLLAALFWAAAQAGQAHDGPHMTRVIADVVAVETEGLEVRLDLRLEALTDPVTLVAATAEGADPATGLTDTPLSPGVAQHRSVLLRFRGTVPDLFTLMLDFGPAGVGTVPVATR